MAANIHRSSVCFGEKDVQYPSSSRMHFFEARGLFLSLLFKNLRMAICPSDMTVGSLSAYCSSDNLFYNLIKRKLFNIRTERLRILRLCFQLSYIIWGAQKILLFFPARNKKKSLCFGIPHIQAHIS